MVGVLGWLGLVAHEVINQTMHHHGNGVLMQALMWAAMIAVMLPLIGTNVRFVALRSPKHRRFQVTADVAAGWAVPWIAAAVVLASLPGLPSANSANRSRSRPSSYWRSAGNAHH